MKLWIDDVRPAPEGYVWCKSVNEAKEEIKDREYRLQYYLNLEHEIELIDIDHDAGDFACDGGDYIKLLDWLEEYMLCFFPIHIHSQNPVGVENMRRIIQRNGWREVK